MKISIQWILAAIIVILLLLVGAYALTNGNNAPATNATATPTTTITPTATVAASPTATPSTAPTTAPTATAKPTPTATPTISGASGVKLTDFGYYITYPPFSNNDINVNPNYVRQGDYVYFSPTSATITRNVDMFDVTEGTDAVAVVHRSGNLSGTTHVTIDVSYDGNIDDWSFPNNDDTDSADVTFAPGESVKTIGINVWTDSESSTSVGHLKLRITHVDGVDSAGSNDMFTLNVNTQSNPTPTITPSGPTVNFHTASVTYDTSGYALYDLKEQLDRSGDTSNALTVNIVLDQNTNNIEGDTLVTFNAGESTASFNYYVKSKDVTQNEIDTYSFSIASKSNYIVGTPGKFTINVDYELDT